jgi:hypothetical protein
MALDMKKNLTTNHTNGREQTKESKMKKVMIDIMASKKK